VAKGPIADPAIVRAAIVRAAIVRVATERIATTHLTASGAVRHRSRATTIARDLGHWRAASPGPTGRTSAPTALRHGRMRGPAHLTVRLVRLADRRVLTAGRLRIVAGRPSLMDGRLRIEAGRRRIVVGPRLTVTVRRGQVGRLPASLARPRTLTGRQRDRPSITPTCLARTRSWSPVATRWRRRLPPVGRPCGCWSCPSAGPPSTTSSSTPRPCAFPWSKSKAGR
jgi:hypothetical protein